MNNICARNFSHDKNDTERCLKGELPLAYGNKGTVIQPSTDLLTLETNLFIRIVQEELSGTGAPAKRDKLSLREQSHRGLGLGMDPVDITSNSIICRGKGGAGGSILIPQRGKK